MLRQRLIISLLILPPGLICMYLGGGLYFAVFVVFFAIAAYEYVQMMRVGGLRPALPLVVGGVLALSIAQTLPIFWPASEPRLWLISGGALMALLIVATTWHLVDYERGAAPAAGADWAVTIAGLVYLGWGGGYFIYMRELPDGLWWTFIALPAIWLADSGAYVAGKRWGKHLMTPRLSPKKTWEGLVGGLLTGALSGASFGWLGSLVVPPESYVSALSGAVVGFVVATTGVLGDLGISMLKRQAGIKDTSNLLGAHGGLLDRIDSWIIAGPVAYFVIVLFFQ